MRHFLRASELMHMFLKQNCCHTCDDVQCSTYSNNTYNEIIGGVDFVGKCCQGLGAVDVQKREQSRK